MMFTCEKDYYKMYYMELVEKQQLLLSLLFLLQKLLFFGGEEGKAANSGLNRPGLGFLGSLQAFQACFSNFLCFHQWVHEHIHSLMSLDRIIRMYRKQGKWDDLGGIQGLDTNLSHADTFIWVLFSGKQGKHENIGETWNFLVWGAEKVLYLGGELTFWNSVFCNRLKI